MDLNLTIPTSWQSLSLTQLRYVYFLLSQNYTADEVKTYCLVRWSGMTVVGRERHSYRIEYDKHTYRITATQLAELLPYLDYLDTVPSTPIRLSRIGKHTAVATDLDSVPFRDYLCCDNLYTGFLQTRNDTLLNEIAAILYRSDNRLSLTPEERVSVFYWFASLKSYYSRRFSHLFAAASTPTGNLLSEASSTQSQLQSAMDNQIRALTHGDVTKEEQVLSTDTLRALTELDALAREYQDLQKELHR